MSKNLITRKIQFLFLIGAILLAPSIARASAVPASVDSLQNLLQNDTDADNGPLSISIWRIST